MKKIIAIIALLPTITLFGCASEQAVNKLAIQPDFNFPEEWGELISSELFEPEWPTYDDFPIAEIYELDFENDVEAFYQNGIDKLYWVQKVDEGGCEIYEKYNQKIGHFDECGYADHPKDLTVGVYEDGFLKKSAVDTEVLDDVVINYTPTVMLYLANDKYQLFSPMGKWMLKREYIWEGCEVDVVSSDELKSKALGLVSCDPLMAFSGDEDVVAIVSNYGGMAAPSADLILVKSDEVATVLELLAVSPDNFSDFVMGPMDIRSLISIDSVDTNSVVFTVSDGAKDWLKTGTFEYNFENGGLSEL